MIVDRTGTSQYVPFTTKQRAELCAILNVSEEHAHRFLEDLQEEIMVLRADWQSLGETPPETPGTAKKVLKELAESAKKMIAALDRLDPTGSYSALHWSLYDRKSDIRIVHQLDSDLKKLRLAIPNALENINKPKLGRRRDTVERLFIGKVGQLYVKHFKKKPTYSRGTRFPRFIDRVLYIALPGNSHTNCDNSKIVESALLEYRVSIKRKSR